MIGSTHRFTIGDFVCVAFCDADQVRDGYGLFGKIEPDVLKQGFTDLGYQPDALKFSMNILYIKTPEHSILVDTGLGVGMSKLPESLLLAGIELNKIDTIIITHGHGDHIGGIIGSDGTPTFPKAKYAIWKDEWEHWLGEATKDENPNPAAKKNLLPIQDKVILIEEEGEIVPGVQAVHAPGHTMGHMALLVASKGEKLLHIVDAAHHPIQLAHPEWSPNFDVRPDVSVATRKHLFERAADENLLMMAYHFAFPGLGKVERAGDVFKWEPINS
jgi:glyoxylase-like metal-dependent hydrolase (beta-lactamase superfamily II)